MRWIRDFQAIRSDDLLNVGGKGLNLGLLQQAGLPVPPGFCIMSDAYRQGSLDHELWQEIDQAYAALGCPCVAVRSSATSEDGELTSFAGQQETILGVQGVHHLLEAVTRCWQSLRSARAEAYRQQRGVEDADAAMGVVVQRLVEAEVSGVLFTRDPLDATGERMLVEASLGLGESVVSGRVTPDRFHIDRTSGVIQEQQVSTKRIMLTSAGEQPVSEDRQAVPCLDQGQLSELAELGRRIEQLCAGPRDIEWAWAEGQFWILQARPITAASAWERDQIRREEIATLRARAEPRGTVWARYNLAEILPTPTPMTWAIVRRFMSGRGGYGLMLRDLGFDPDPIIDEEGFIDLICGRPYVNLSREPKLYFRGYPASHPFTKLKEEPAKAFYSRWTLDPELVTASYFFRLPIIFWKMLRNYSRMSRQSQTYTEHLERAVFPAFVAEVEQAKTIDLAQMSPDALLGHLHHWIKRTLDDFARHSLRPTVFLGLAIAQLEQAFAKTTGQDAAAAQVRTLLTGVHPDPAVNLAGGLRELSTSRMSREEFLRRFGHRGPQEMELSQPRWSEEPVQLSAIAPHVQPPAHTPATESASWWNQVITECKLDARSASRLEPTFKRAIAYSALREAAKHYLMLGYAQIRRALLEIDARYRLRGGVFFLTPDELPRLVQGEDLSRIIHDRRRRRQLLLSLEAPPVLFSDELEAIGRPCPVVGAKELTGTPLSSGIAEGPALVLTEPCPASHTSSGFILVCPSTDPAWVPLFLKAKGLVMETGGILSHGAIVAREFGLPAVAGIPNAHRQLRSGQMLKVDGNTGKVYVLDAD